MCDLSMKVCQYGEVKFVLTKEEKMKLVLVSLAVVAMLSGCAGARKAGVTSETTGGGSSAEVDSSPMDFSMNGSDSGKIDGLKTVHFDFDSAALVDSEKKTLEGNAEWMKKNSSVKMLIEGHCDQRGSNEYNLSLGERRANTIKSMLVKMGIKSDRLSVVSFGEEKLISEGDSEAEMAKNRRANFVPSK